MRFISKFIKLFAVCALLHSCSLKKTNRYTDWKICGGSKENIHYSSLKQLDTTNINKLRIAWIYHTGDADTANHSQIQCNPIIIDGVLYGTTPKLKLIALNASTGKKKWVFDPLDPHQAKPIPDLTLNNN